MSQRPVVEQHDGILVVRDDLITGGTKARYAARAFGAAAEAVYASPCEGGAQVALAATARRLGRRATIFCAKRAKPHRRTIQARDLGATVVLVDPGYLSVVQARAKGYAARVGAILVPFGFDLPGCVDAIAGAAASIGECPDEVWCAAGSGVLARGLAKAWPDARRRVVQVGRRLSDDDVAGAVIHVAPMAFSRADKRAAPFPACPHYDVKAWHECRARRGAGLVLFWNVLGA